MLKERRAAVVKVTADFLKAEQAIDEAARHAASCMSTMLVQRAEANLPLGTGLKAIELMNDVAALLVRARKLSVDVHVELAMIPEEIGIRNFGHTSPCPPATAAHETVPHLQIVA